MNKLKTLLLESLARFTVVREVAILLAFCAMTALVTWPYVTRLVVENEYIAADRRADYYNMLMHGKSYFSFSTNMGLITTN